MAKKIYADFEFKGGAKVTGLPSPTAPSDAVTLQYVEGQLQGLNWKLSARVASTTNVNIASPGAAIDGITLAEGERVLLKDQSTPAQNGLYVFNGAAAAMARAEDGDTFLDYEAAVVVIEEGSLNAGTTWRQTAVNGAIGIDDLLFIPFGVVTPDASATVAGKIELATQTEVNEGTAVGGTGAAIVVTPDKLAAWPGQAKRYALSIGDGVSTSFTITHGLGTRDLVISVYENGGTYDEVLADIKHTSANQLTLSFSEAPAENAYRVVVVG